MNENIEIPVYLQPTETAKMRTLRYVMLGLLAVYTLYECILFGTSIISWIQYGFVFDLSELSILIIAVQSISTYIINTALGVLLGIYAWRYLNRDRAKWVPFAVYGYQMLTAVGGLILQTMELPNMLRRYTSLSGDFPSYNETNYSLYNVLSTASGVVFDIAITAVLVFTLICLLKKKKYTSWCVVMLAIDVLQGLVYEVLRFSMTDSWYFENFLFSSLGISFAVALLLLSLYRDERQVNQTTDATVQES